MLNRTAAICLASISALFISASWTPPKYDPLAKAKASIGKTKNLEAGVPSQCYTKTAGIANPCWTCHTEPEFPNVQQDWELQEEYAFSDFALTNRWSNLFTDRQAEAKKITDDEALRYVREDNYQPLRDALQGREDYPGYVPDLDFDQGFDKEGFAKDGSQWRAIRYKPFLGTFWPTNGSTDDVFIRLPKKFRLDAKGKPSREIYKTNLSILEAAIASQPVKKGQKRSRRIEPLDERVSGLDLNGDGKKTDGVTRIEGLPSHFAGAAKDIKVTFYAYPEGTEFLHSVRYIDPDQPSLLSKRMKELRYSVKRRFLDRWGILYRYEQELEDKEKGNLPIYDGNPMVGLRNKFGWQLQGFIEDEQGRLRLQTEEEHRFCMGCHSSLSITVDQTFAFARKVPGPEGWRWQDARGIRDVPQHGHKKPEIHTYFERVTGGDELRANEEILERFFPNGKLDVKKVQRAAKGGDKDITFLIAPSRKRALKLNKAYMALVRQQTFHLGRDTLLAPPANVHRKIENGETELGRAGKIFIDGRMWLDWER